MLRFDQQVRLPGLFEADYVHDVAYDFYGTRLALCTSSLRISIFAAQPGQEELENSSWTEIARMEKAHTGPIWRLCWGHPEYGEPLISCSEDNTVKVWFGGRVASQLPAHTTEAFPPKWDALKSLTDFDGPVVDVRVSPPSLGMKLATVTADGKARVFEKSHTTEWDHEDLELPKQGPGAASSAASSTCTSAALDWMPGPFGSPGPDARGEVLAVGSRQLTIWVKQKDRKWEPMANAEVHSISSGGIKDVAWCPNLCRTYEVVATCGAGAALWRVDFPPEDASRQISAYGRKDAAVKLTLLKQLIPSEDEACPVWRCSWNLIGSCLALCPEGSEVQVWKADAAMEWRPESDIDLSGSA